MPGHDDPPDDAFVSLSETKLPPRADDESAQPVTRSSGADPNAFAFVSASAEASIRQTAENAIAQQVGRGAAFLFFIGGAQLVFMVFVTSWIAEGFHRLNQPAAFDANPASAAATFMAWGLGLIIGGVFLALGFWARRDPLLAPQVGLGFYLVVNLLDFAFLVGPGIMLLPGGFWVIWLFRVLFVVFLLDAIRAGVAYKRIVNKMIAEMRREH